MKVFQVKSKKGKGKSANEKLLIFTWEIKTLVVICPGHDLVVRGGSKRGVIPAGEQRLQGLLQLGLFARQTHPMLSSPFPLTGFQMGLPTVCDRKGMAAKARTSSHLLKAGRMVLFFAITLWPVKEKVLIFHFWTLGVRATHSQCKVKPLNYCSFSIFFLPLGEPFYKLLENPRSG